MSTQVVISYSIITAKDTESLVHAMQEAIAEDWEPIGGIAVETSVISGPRYIQSLVLRGSSDDSEVPHECRVCKMRDACPIA